MTPNELARQTEWIWHHIDEMKLPEFKMHISHMVESFASEKLEECLEKMPEIVDCNF